MKVIVFDFDGTISYKDSLHELFKEQMRGFKKLYIIYYYSLKILSRIKLTSVKFEKEQMIKVLFKSDVLKFENACKRQAKNFTLSPIYNEVINHINIGNRVIIVSASAMPFLEEIFRGINVEIIGSDLKTEHGKILSITQHPFHYEKNKCLKDRNINTIDEMYYDSHWDECLIPMCLKWHKVKNGKIIYNGERIN